MKKEGWFKIYLNIDEQDVLMFRTALEEEGIQVVDSSRSSSGQDVWVTKKYPGHILFIPDDKRISALSVLQQFLEDFQIDKSTVMID